MNIVWKYFPLTVRVTSRKEEGEDDDADTPQVPPPPPPAPSVDGATETNGTEVPERGVCRVGIEAMNWSERCVRPAKKCDYYCRTSLHDGLLGRRKWVGDFSGVD